MIYDYIYTRRLILNTLLICAVIAIAAKLLPAWQAPTPVPRPPLTRVTFVAQGLNESPEQVAVRSPAMIALPGLPERRLAEMDAVQAALALNTLALLPLKTNFQFAYAGATPRYPLRYAWPITQTFKVRAPAMPSFAPLTNALMPNMPNIYLESDNPNFTLDRLDRSQVDLTSLPSIQTLPCVVILSLEFNLDGSARHVVLDHASTQTELNAELIRQAYRMRAVDTTDLPSFARLHFIW